MKLRLATLVAILALGAGSSAHAANVCLSLGAAQVVASGLTIPAKGTCAAFNGFFRGKDKAGMLLAGDICKSTDGSTVMFNTFTQQNSQPDSLIGSWSTSTLSGTGRECVAGATCLSFPVKLTKCPASLPIFAPSVALESQTSSRLTTEEP